MIFRNTIFMLITILVVHALDIVWHLPLCIVGLLGLRLYRVSDDADANAIVNKLTPYATYRDDDRPRGWICGMQLRRPYVGYIHITERWVNGENMNVIVLWILTSRTLYEELSRKQIASKTDEITQYYRSNNYYNISYKPRIICTSRFSPRWYPHDVIGMMMDMYLGSLSRSICIWLHGETGIGKSTAAIILARMLNACITSEFNPTDPGDTFSELYQTASPSDTMPLVVLIDEADIIVRNIHRGIKRHKDLVHIADKQGFNRFLDEIHVNYAHVILIMTSNMSHDDLRAIDPSYARRLVPVCL